LIQYVLKNYFQNVQTITFKINYTKAGK